MPKKEKSPQEKAKAIHKIIGEDKEFMLIMISETPNGSNIETMHNFNDRITALGILEVAKADINKKA